MTGKRLLSGTGTFPVWLSDWYCSKNDRNILYHAAPSTGNCYDLDGQTGAFFYNTAGFLFSSGKCKPPSNFRLGGQGSLTILISLSYSQ